MIFTANQLHQMVVCCKYVDEVFVDLRKGKAQTRYIVYVPVGSQYFCLEDDVMKTVDPNLTGYWMQEFYGDNSWDGYLETLQDNDGWVKCKSVEVTTLKWEKIDEQ